MDSDGTRMTHHIFSVGSGSTYAYGVLDANYQYDMSIDEARELGKRAIYHATYRDTYSGGTVNCMYTIAIDHTLNIVVFILIINFKVTYLRTYVSNKYTVFTM